MHRPESDRSPKDNAACPPSDIACDTAGRFNRVILWLATILYLMGFFVAYVLVPLLSRFD
jgi:hypothetical protein